MASSEQNDPPYTKTIDLTSRAQQQERRARAQEAMEERAVQQAEVSVDELPPSVRAALDTIGWPSLMPVQQAAIPYLLDKQDLIAQSRTGSGKTGAFLLPLFELLDPKEKAAQALVLAPTRELARQIHTAFEEMRGSATDEALQSVCVYGGVRYGEQNKALRQGAQVVIGTPGRILDHLERRTFGLSNLRVLILDEADEMLSMGFYPAMQQLQRYLPKQRTSYMFSATIPPKVQSLAREFLNKPGFLALSTGDESVDAIDHRYYVVPAMDKDRVLVKLIEMENPDSAIIFANTKRDVDYLTRFLQNFGHDADGISGDLSQKAREHVMQRLRDDSLRFLVATDVAARGIDISDLSHVFMYDVPQDPEYFIHRSGRTARAGKSGVAIVLTTHTDKTGLLRIGKRYGVELEEREVPSDDAVNERVSERMTVLLEDRMRAASNLQKERMERFVPLAQSLAQEEPELLAMLLDKMYHDHLHAPETGPASGRAPARQKQSEERRSKKKSSGRRKKRTNRSRGQQRSENKDNSSSG